MRTPKGHATSGLVTSAHVRSRWTRPYHGGYGQSRRARLSTAVHVGHVDVASSSPCLGCSPVWMSVRPAMRSILYGSRSSSISFIWAVSWNPRACGLVCSMVSGFHSVGSGLSTASSPAQSVSCTVYSTAKRSQSR